MYCTACGQPLGILGILGSLAHLYCRACGLHFHTDAAVLECEPEDDDAVPVWWPDEEETGPLHYGDLE